MKLYIVERRMPRARPKGMINGILVSIHCRAAYAASLPLEQMNFFCDTGDQIPFGEILELLLIHSL